MPYDWCYLIFSLRKITTLHDFKLLHHFCCCELPSVLFFCSIQVFFFFLSFKNVPNSAEPTWKILACLGVSFTAIVLCSSSWMFFEKRHTESKQLLSSPQAAAQRVWFQHLDLVHSFIEYMDWVHLLNLKIAVCQMRAPINTSESCWQVTKCIHLWKHWHTYWNSCVLLIHTSTETSSCFINCFSNIIISSDYKA